MEEEAAEELSTEQAFARFWIDEAFHDMSLQGSDGVRVPLNRNSLAAKSQFFRTMLLGEFSETTSDVVNIGEFSGALLRTLVEYLYTGTTKVLAVIGPHTEEVITEENNDEFQLLLSLTRAAEYFHLPQLSKRAHTALSNRLKVYPALSFPLLEASRDAGTTMPKELVELAWTNIRSGTLDDVVTLLSSTSLLEEIIQDKQVDDWEKFGILNRWASSPGEESRQAIARALVAKHVCLDRIDPRHLSSAIASTGLVTMDQLLEAYKLQALAATVLHGVDFVKLPVAWMSSSSHVFSNSKGTWYATVLKCPSPIGSGTVHRWTIKVEIESGNNVMLGIAKKPGTLTNHHLGHQNQCTSWGYKSSNGDCYHGGTNVPCGPSYGKGSQITFELNLLPDGEHSGTLRASKDGGDYFDVASNLLDQLDEEGFVPAASVASAFIRIVEFEKL